MPCDRVDQLDVKVVDDIQRQILPFWLDIAVEFGDIFTTKIMEYINCASKSDVQKASDIMKKLKENAVSLVRFYKVLHKCGIDSAYSIIIDHLTNEARLKLKDYLRPNESPLSSSSSSSSPLNSSFNNSASNIILTINSNQYSQNHQQYGYSQSNNPVQNAKPTTEYIQQMENFHQ